MSNTQNVTEALADLHSGVVRTLAAICRQLIEARVLNEDQIHSTMIEVAAALAVEGAGTIGASVPISLSAALRQSAQKQP